MRSTGGFFPLDPAAHSFPLYTDGARRARARAPQMVGTEPMLCNLWPYWYSSTAFGAGNGCKGDQYLFPPSLIPPDTATRMPDRHELRRQVVRRPAGLVPRLVVHRRGALPVHLQRARSTLQFYGDDDMFIFINGILVIDLGGVHQRLPGKVTVDGATGRRPSPEGGSLDADRDQHPALRAAAPIRTPAWRSTSRPATTATVT